MSYITLEVEIDHGQILPREPSKLPAKGKGLLTLLESNEAPNAKLTPIEAFHELQKHLDLDETKAKAWMEMIRDARR